MTKQFANMTPSSNFFDAVLFPLPSLVNVSSFMSISSLVMTVFFYKGLTRNLEIRIPPCEFYPISGDWGELGILNLARMSLMICYGMLQNVRVTIFTFSELLREKQQEGRGNITSSQPRLGLTPDMHTYALVTFEVCLFASLPPGYGILNEIHREKLQIQISTRIDKIES